MRIIVWTSGAMVWERSPEDDTVPKQERNSQRGRGMDKRIADWIAGYEMDELVAMALCGDMVGLRFGVDHYRVRVAVPEGGLAAFDAFSFDDEFDGNLDHDLAILPKAIVDTLDSTIENGVLLHGDPLLDYRMLFGRLAHDVVARDQSEMPLNVRVRMLDGDKASQGDAEHGHGMPGVDADAR